MNIAKIAYRVASVNIDAENPVDALLEVLAEMEGRTDGAMGDPDNFSSIVEEIAGEGPVRVGPFDLRVLGPSVDLEDDYLNMKVSIRVHYTGETLFEGDCINNPDLEDAVESFKDWVRTPLRPGEDRTPALVPVGGGDQPMTKIEHFAGDHAFLSNFYEHPVLFEGTIYPTSEAAFQAAKTENPAEREKIRLCKKPGQAKAAGKKVTLRRDWNFLRTEYMEKILREKFADPTLREKLRATGDADLVEGNSWNDTFWGVCRGRGDNRLGKILMKIRADIQAQGGLQTPPGDGSRSEIHLARVNRTRLSVPGSGGGATMANKGKKRVQCTECKKMEYVKAREVAWGKQHWICQTCNDRSISQDNIRAYEAQHASS